jgi:hypothetical protein
MKKINDYFLLGFIFFTVFNLFFKNSAEADPKHSYENFIASKVKEYLSETNINAINLGGYSDLIKKNLPIQSHP